MSFLKEGETMTKAKFRFDVLIMAIVLFTIFLRSNEQKQIQNTLKEINSCEGKLKLNLVREWGGIEPTQEEQIFVEPRDIEIGRDGLIYILDSGDNKIQVFDESAKFVRTIGKEGKGPGEFSYLNDIVLDDQNHLIVSDELNQRIQILDSQGKYLGGFKLGHTNPPMIVLTQRNEFVMFNMGLRKKSPALFLRVDYEGKIVGEIAKQQKLKSSRKNLIRFLSYYASDDQGNLCVAYHHRPLLEKYASSNEFLWEASYELPFKMKNPEGSWDEIIARGLSLDSQGRIYIVSLRRKPKRKEGAIGLKIYTRVTGKGVVKISSMKPKFDSETTDLYQLLLFDRSGKVIAAKNLDVFCDAIKVYKDRLFIIDSCVAAKIYEYKISIE